ncbi:E3 SUMO-protein ligase ZBED1-like [Astyanax mexicanus]|uniref:E3 SUMO-protein ligase ZBED1-like n=1 Tax=Astyanax mexicanus TaxID=7994 RepID=UPI0020CAFD89|nr:E3 SUMO-protein ligase ZBED1-like [Astyanax mexicanus]
MASRENPESESEEEGEPSALDDIVPKKGRTTSNIWKWFGYLKSDQAQLSPKCRICRRAVQTKTGNTTNLFHHLKKYHPVEYTESVNIRSGAASQPLSHGTSQPSSSGVSPKQQSIVATFASITPYETKTKRHQEITKAVTYFMAKDMMPLSTVEKEGFKNLVKVLDSRYQLPGRKYFSQTALPLLYEECRAKLEAELKLVRHFATTADMWSSRTSEPYLSLTVHYIDEEWNLQNRCLQTAFVPEDHTAEIISHALEDALASWGLREERQVCITTDNGANIAKAVSLKKWTRLQCFGHRLHLAIERGGRDSRIQRAIGVCKKVVSAFSFSWKKQKALAAAQEELNLPKHKLVTESPTRWGSRQKMVGRLIEQEKAIVKVLSTDKKTRHLVPTWQDVDILESVHKALSPLVSFTDALSGETYVSVSYVKPVLHLLNEDILKPDADDSDLTKSIKTTVISYLNEKYDEAATDDLLDIASLLDPRFKTRYVKEDKVNGIKARAMAEMLHEGLNNPEADSTLKSTEDEGGDATPAKKQKMTLGSFFKKPHAVTTAGLTEQEAAEAELNNYLLAPDADR